MYTPSDDSLFFNEFLKLYLEKKNFCKKFTILDMGTGSGILARNCSTLVKKNNILSVDIQRECVTELNKQGFRTLRSDLFSKVPLSNKFDLILFNAPYLPRNNLEDKKSQIETTGGKRGDEVSIRFLKQAKGYLKDGGKILLLVSSLTPLDKINKFNPKIVARKKIWFEELLILEF